MHRPKHEDYCSSSLELPITPLPASNPLQDHLSRKGLYGGLPMQQPLQTRVQQFHPKRPSFHPSGAETDTDLPLRKRTRSPPKNPTQTSPDPGPIRRPNSFNTPPQQTKIFLDSGGLTGTGLLGLTGIAGVRARSAADQSHEPKKEEEQDEREKHRSSRMLDGGSIGSVSDLTLFSDVTSEQWNYLRNEHELQGMDGDDEDSMNGDGGLIGGQQKQQQQELWGSDPPQEVHIAQRSRGPFSGLERAQSGGLRGAQGMGPSGGYQGGTLGHPKYYPFSLTQGDVTEKTFTNSLGGRPLQSHQEQHNQLDDNVGFTDNFEEGDYTGEFDAAIQEDVDEQQYNLNSGGPRPGQLGPNHPPSGTVYSPPPSTPPKPSGFDPPSPTLSDGPPVTINDLLSLDYSPENTIKRFNFFRNCTHPEWAKHGDLILDRQSQLVKEIMKNREERRATVKAFEDELKKVEERVDERMENARAYMNRMKTSFNLMRVG